MFDMLGTIIKNFFSGHSTRLAKREPFADARGQLSGIDADACIYCGLCARKCPALAITVDKPTKTWKLDPFKCVVCAVCEETCPKKCMKMDEHYRKPVTRKEPLIITQQPKPEAEAEA